MKKLIYNPSQIVTVNSHGKNFKRGKELNEIEFLTDHSIILEHNVIKDIVSTSNVTLSEFDEIIDISGKLILPGLVECHTHTAFSGSRANEFKERISGISYEDIARRGGGINSTVNAVRNSSFENIVNAMKPRIFNFISQGITTLEIKSGYGLDFENEIKLLKAINYVNQLYPIDIIPTFLGAHTIPPEHKKDRNKYINILTNDLIPYVAENELAYFCDGFCESTAFSAAEIDVILLSAKEAGLGIKLHTEQFNTIGGLDVALKYEAVSIDHLEFITSSDIKKLSNVDTVSVLLPGVSFFLDYQYAPARELINNNAIVALSTDFNPGSSHINNIHFIMWLAAIKMKMNIEEIISAVTINAAKALKLEDDRGSIELNKKGDFAIFDVAEYSELIYNVGINCNYMTIKDGEIIYQS